MPVSSNEHTGLTRQTSEVLAARLDARLAGVHACGCVAEQLLRRMCGWLAVGVAGCGCVVHWCQGMSAAARSVQQAGSTKLLLTRDKRPDYNLSAAAAGSEAGAGYVRGSVPNTLWRRLMLQFSAQQGLVDTTAAVGIVLSHLPGCPLTPQAVLAMLTRASQKPMA